jgi:hypothetical protein
MLHDPKTVATRRPATNLLPRLLLATALFGAFGLRPAGAAEVIPPGTGLTTTFDAVNISVTYRPADTGYETVITAGTEVPGSVVRFVSTLVPGQEALVSVPRGAGQPALELRLRRVGDRLELQRPMS